MRSLIAACVVLGLMAATASAGVLGMSDEAIYADAMWGAGGNTINVGTGDHSDWIQDPANGNAADLKWDNNAADWDGGLTAAGESGGTSLYSNDDPLGATPAPVLRTTATGLNAALTYNVYLTYYDQGLGVNASITGDPAGLQTYFGNYNINTGVTQKAEGLGNTAKLALLGTVTGETSVSIDVGSTGGSYWDGLLVDLVPPTFMEVLGDGAIYADANESNTAPADVLGGSWMHEDPGDLSYDDEMWANNDTFYGWNGGLDENGDPGGASLYTYTDGSVAETREISTTATGLDPALEYNVYAVFYDGDEAGGQAIRAAITGDPLQEYWQMDVANGDIDSGIQAWAGGGTAKLVLLGQVDGTDSVSIDVGTITDYWWTMPPSFGAATYYEGLAVVPVPEPSTLVLAFSGLLGLLVIGWRRRK